jgi:gamma-glutamyltranspeptidase/glutathione hydrolase
MPRALGPSISWAKANAPERVTVLDALSKRGGLGLSQDAVAVELLAVGGRAVGGLLTRDDLGSVRPAVERLSERSLTPHGVFRVPWSLTEAESSHVQVVAACDARGRVAIACYETPDDGLPIPSLGLAVPRHAAPVMRGARRVAPGTPRPAGAPVALRVRGGLIEAAVGVARTVGAQAAVESILAALEQSISLSEVLVTIDRGCPVVLAGLHGAPRLQIRARSTP